MESIIRPWEFSDAAALARAINNPRVQDNLRDGLPFPYTEEDARGYIGYVLSADARELAAFAIEYEGRLAGSISLTRGVNIHRRTAELGYYVGEPFWGRGLHTAMTAWLFVLASFHLGLHGASVWNRAERFAGRVRSALFLIFLAAGAFCFVQSGLWNDMLFLGGPKYFPGGMPEFLVWHLGTAFFFCLLARLFVTRAGREGRR